MWIYHQKKGLMWYQRIWLQCSDFSMRPWHTVWGHTEETYCSVYPTQHLTFPFSAHTVYQWHLPALALGILATRLHSCTLNEYEIFYTRLFFLLWIEVKRCFNHCSQKGATFQVESTAWVTLYPRMVGFINYYKAAGMLYYCLASSQPIYSSTTTTRPTTNNIW